MTIAPTVRRAAVVLVAGAAAVLTAAGPAFAHVEVEAAPARALATNATLTMTAEAESSTAGITGVRIQLPSGLVPADLTLASGPTGWRLTGSGAVVDVKGPALPVGRSLRLGLKVRQLPAGSQLVLKTVQSYSDGQSDAWIEVPSDSVPDPDQPAPVVRLQAAAPGATPLPRATTPAPTAAAPTSATPTTAAPSTAAGSSAPAVAEAAADDDNGSGAAWLFGGVLIGVVLLGGIVFAASRKAAKGRSDS
ncbi:MAG TPA: DUF1775 domain-containing protein [Mycobacteriales bacterium]|nr:DUF1775 domain-containing protein [Mycobacteriales bacterium]